MAPRVLFHERVDVSSTTIEEEKMKTWPLFQKSAPLAAFALALLMGSPFASAQKEDSEQVSQLLVDARSYAIQAEHDAETLDTYSRSSLPWKSHAWKLASMKDHVNNLGKVAKQLSDLNSEASPWQQQAINQIDPLLRDMADHLGRTITYVNEHQSQVNVPPFREYVARNYQLAERTAEMIRDFVAYDEAKSAAESLEQKLEIAEK